MSRVMQVPRWFMFSMTGGLLVSLAAGAAALAPNAMEVRPLDPTLIQQADTLSLAFEQAADHIGPSVVSITSEKRFSVAGRQSVPQQIPEEFRRFFGDDFSPFLQPRSRQPRNSIQRGFGSGVIVSSDGYILTNNHVVDGADEVTVKTVDEETYKAEVVGRDPKSDVALLKVEASGLPAAQLANSDAVKVGQWVLAVGGPFGLEKTVTAGIVSATGRNTVGIADYENFIQTDAAINPGNSGGPLVNLHGEVVGINTAIASRSGSNAGIGFSIPINMARNIMDSLKETGRVDRGYLGAMIQNLTRDLAASFQFDGDNGVLIGDVAPNGPAEKAGLQSGDIVVSLNDKAMLNASQLRNTVAAMRPGKTATLEVFRDGKVMTVDVEIGLLDEEAIVAASSDEASSDDLGMTVKTLTPEIAEQLELDGDEQGVVVTEVEAGGFAARAGLQPGTIIVSVNGKQTPNVTSFQEALKDNRPEDGIRLQVKVDGFTRYLFLRKR